jgi:hypothetical protein
MLHLRYLKFESAWTSNQKHLFPKTQLVDSFAKGWEANGVSSFTTVIPVMGTL